MYFSYRLSLITLLTLLATVAQAQDADKKVDESRLTLDRIYNSPEFASRGFSARWLKDGSGYVNFEPSKTVSGGRNLVLHQIESTQKKVIVPAEDFIPAGQTTPLAVHDYAFSADRSLLLIYTNSKRVWRRNTRGDYWILDRSNHELRKLGGDGPSSTMMFAKISPTNDQVAYVRNRNIFVENLRDDSIQQLTETDTEDIINGTFDWVYEEEVGLRDGFRWSPDGKSIAFWQINTEGVRKFPLINNTDRFYPAVTWFAYPKTGETNSECRIGVVNVSKQGIRWIKTPGDLRDDYVARMDWAGNSNELILQQLNRLQNTNEVMIANVNGGTTKTILTEKDEAWVNVHDELFWLKDRKRFTWISERDGWRHVYLASRDGGAPKQLTSGKFDVIRLLGIDEERDVLYFIASPSSAAQRYLYGLALDGSDPERLTPEELAGWNSYQLSPNFNWAIHSHSSANTVPSTQLVEVSTHKTVRSLEKNDKLKEKIEKLDRPPTEFFKVEIGDGIKLDGWCIKPADFQPNEKYPLIMYVYGEPAGQTVSDRWGGSSYLWHLMLAQRGYIVMSIDNRGTAAPRGREFRKMVYRQIGILGPKDQAAALQELIKERPYIDKDRIGIWGWSGGGSSTLQAMFKYPDLYHVGVSIAPVPNQRYYDTIYQERYMGIPKDNVDGYRDGSAINFAKNLKGDLLLVHGTGDDNCHYQTTEKLINELIKYNKPFTMMAYPNRSHSIREGKNTTRHLRALMTNFFLSKLPANK